MRGGCLRILLIDTCGDAASIALAEGTVVVAIAAIPARTASATLLVTLDGLLQQVSWVKDQIEAVGLVNGPGSFTGVRVGLSCAKGLCEALSIPLAIVSRLQVLADTVGLANGYAALNAGRGEVFVMDVLRRTEFLQSREAFFAGAADARIAVCEPQLKDAFGGANTELIGLTASDSLRLVRERLRAGGDDVASADANYVRGEQQIYGKVNSPSDRQA